MSLWTVHAARAHLSDLVARAERGEEIVIARAGVPAVRIVPYTAHAEAPRVPGSAKGELSVPDDFDDPLPPELLAAFR